jgi:hypothetical protein
VPAFFGAQVIDRAESAEPVGRDPDQLSHPRGAV